MFEKTLISLWIFLFCVVLVSGQYEGDQCSTPTYQPGVCSTTQKCPSILNNLKQGQHNHGVCGFEGFEQIVCCPIVATAPKPSIIRGTSGTRPTVATTPKPATSRGISGARPTAATPKPATSRGINEERISVKKCSEYKHFAFNKIYVTNVFTVEPVEKEVSNCAFTSVALIVGGIEAKQREFPHMALIGYRDGNTIHWECGGTLISEQFVVSAGHCFNTSFGPARYVRLGEHDLSRTDEATHVDLNIIQRIPHPDYKPSIVYNDIGLFKLERKVQLNGAIRPACLPESESAVTMGRVIASGWGDVEYKGPKSSILQRVVLDMFSQQECNSIYSAGIRRGIVEKTQICAGSKDKEKDTCQGDSGGPLQVYHPTHSCTYTIVGVTSFGMACGNIGTPGVYTRVAAYLSWIEGIVWPNEK